MNQEGYKPETAEDELRESFEFVKIIEDSVVETFPFDSDEERNSFIEKIESIKKHFNIPCAELIGNIHEALASLNNTHTYLDQKGKIYFDLDRQILFEAGKFWTQNKGQVYEVVSVDGTPINEIVRKKIEGKGGGTADFKIDRALRYGLTAKGPAAAVLAVQDRENHCIELKSKYANKAENQSLVLEQTCVSGKILDGDIGYLKIDSWDDGIKINSKSIADLVEKRLKTLAVCPSIIIDVRQNSGGNSALAERLAGHFVNERAQFGSVIKKDPKTSELVESKLYLDPRGDFLDKKIAILTGPMCLSANEMFILMLKDTGKAVTLGETTGGGSGNPKSLDLNFSGQEYKLSVSTWKLIRNSGKKLENIGIEPDIPVTITPDDVFDQRDRALEAALEYACG